MAALKFDQNANKQVKWYWILRRQTKAEDEIEKNKDNTNCKICDKKVKENPTGREQKCKWRQKQREGGGSPTSD